MKIHLYNQEDLNYVEFTILSLKRPYRRHTENARFLHAHVFSVVQYVYETSHKDYCYYNAVCYKDESLKVLQESLQAHILKLNDVSNSIQLETLILKQIEGIDFMNEMKTYYPNWRISWENYRDKLIQVCSELLEMVDICLEEEKVLWVKGY
jgi:hypothetical protein